MLYVEEHHYDKDEQSQAGEEQTTSFITCFKHLYSAGRSSSVEFLTP